MGLKEDIRQVLDEMRELNQKEADKASTAGKKRGILDNTVSGATKLVAGGLGAVPTAVGKAVEQIPTGIGRAIGAVPVNPPDYASNPSLKLMGEGADEIGSAARGIGTAARSGVMSALNLKEAPAPTQAPTPVAPTLQQPQKQGAIPSAPIASGMDAAMKDIKATRTAPFGIGGGEPAKPPESAGYIENAATGERINVPKAKPAGEGAGIDSLISQLESDYRNAPTRKLKLGIGNLLVEAEKSRTSLAGTKLLKTETAKERAEAMRERNDLLQQKIDDARAAGEDTRALRKEIAEDKIFQKDLTQFGTDTMGDFNPEKGMFEMGDKGIHLDRPEVERAYSPYKAMKEKIEKQSKAKMTPAQERTFKTNYFKAKGWITE